MPVNVSSNTFPANKVEALTMLYLQSQDLSNISPEDLLDEYEEVYSKISQRDKEH